MYLASVNVTNSVFYCTVYLHAPYDSHNDYSKKMQSFNQHQSLSFSSVHRLFSLTYEINFYTKFWWMPAVVLKEEFGVVNQNLNSQWCYVHFSHITFSSLTNSYLPGSIHGLHTCCLIMTKPACTALHLQMRLATGTKCMYLVYFLITAKYEQGECSSKFVGDVCSSY